MTHLSGQRDADLHHDNGEHRSTARTANGSDVEQHERRAKAHLEQHQATEYVCLDCGRPWPPEYPDPNPDEECETCGGRVVEAV